jgi:hypothetical protein
MRAFTVRPEIFTSAARASEREYTAKERSTALRHSSPQGVRFTESDAIAPKIANYCTDVQSIVILQTEINFARVKPFSPLTTANFFLHFLMWRMIFFGQEAETCSFLN